MDNSIDEQQRRQLLALARESIAHGLRHGRPLSVSAPDYAPELQAKRASFVTLQIGGQLRGCIGSLQAYRPLVDDVANNAFAAAFRDPRFAPLSESELEGLDVHISILSLPEPVEFSSEEDLISQLRPNVDGLILNEGGRTGTFLPSVWESLPEPQAFLRHLKLKAGLSADYWSNTLRVQRYTTESFG